MLASPSVWCAYANKRHAIIVFPSFSLPNTRINTPYINEQKQYRRRNRIWNRQLLHPDRYGMGGVVCGPPGRLFFLICWFNGRGHPTFPTPLYRPWQWGRLVLKQPGMKTEPVNITDIHIASSQKRKHP